MSYPFVYWAQDESNVFLTVDLKDASNISRSVSENVFEFSADGNGAQGRKDYSFSLTLFDNVIMSKQYEEGVSQVRYVLKKVNSGWWPNITKDRSRLSWLRIDFDKFKDPDLSDNSADDFEMLNGRAQDYPESEMSLATRRELLKERSSLVDTPDAFDRLEKFCESFCGVSKTYLFTYNVLMFLINFYIFSVLLYGFLSKGRVFLYVFWSKNSFSIMAATALQLLDIVNAVFGLTKTSPLASSLQVCGRMFIIFTIAGNPNLHPSSTTYCLMLTYFLIELFRYPYYALQSINIESRFVEWMRYNMWIPLYPLGIILEGIVMLSSIQFYYSSNAYSLEMPNPINFSLNFATVLCCVLAALPLVAFYLLSHMWNQRSKKFGALRKKVQ